MLASPVWSASYIAFGSGSPFSSRRLSRPMMSRFVSPWVDCVPPANAAERRMPLSSEWYW